MSFVLTREELEKRELSLLPSYAMRNAESKGREFPEAKHAFRLDFQRDRERIVHSMSYLRLKGKTQVFVAHEGDHFRTRLTHTGEVAQIAQAIARVLQANEDLVIAIALAHDLGHTPFGHAGEEALEYIMHRFGLSFEHNAQSRRIVEKLEKRSPEYDGLNLTRETREGLFKHVTPYDRQKHKLSEHAFLEAQIVDFADQIAYQNHDVQDGLRSGIIDLKSLKKLEVWRLVTDTLNKDLSEDLWVKQAISSLINLMVNDLVEETARRIASLDPKSPDDIRNHSKMVVGFSPVVEDGNVHLRQFLFSNFYRSPEIEKQNEKGKETIRKLFFYYLDHPDELPETYAEIVKKGEPKEVVIKDYIAGMTDAYALEKASSLIL